jgi:hypothetical protein
MPISFTNLSDQIELNEKRLAFEYDRYEKYYSRFTLISILYSVFAIYFLQLFKFCRADNNPSKLLFTISFCLFILSIVYSIYHAILLLIPKDVSFVKLPEEFYKTVRKQYEEKGITNEDELNEYIRASYNQQLEKVVESNA